MSIPRIYFDSLWKEISERKISILLGARQVGKSTLLRQLEDQAKKQGLATSFYDLEQSADLKRLSGNAETVIQELTRKRQIIFIDEFHYLKNASKIFKAIYDSRKRVKIYASGSSSLEIHKHLKESLAGRFFKTSIFPLSLIEWHQVRNFRDIHYLTWGGLPGLISQKTNDKKLALLDNILSTYITKDIKGLIKEENVRAFNSVLYLLAQSQGSMTSASNLARETGLSESTIARHLEVMIQTYVLHPLLSYSTNLANELKKSKKYYFYDLGIRNALLKDVRPAGVRDDKGVLYETAIALHLIFQLKPNMELRFWRTKKGEEVDFVLLKNRIPVPIEVKSRINKPEIPLGIKSFFRIYPVAPFALIFNESLETEIEDAAGHKIYFKKWQAASNLDYLKRIYSAKTVNFGV